MGIDIKINIDFTARQKKIVRAAVVTGAVIGALGIGVALASPIDTTWISSGAQVSAASLKTDLDGLQTQITAGRFVAAVGSKQYSVGATKFVASTGTGGGGPHGNGTYSGLEIGHYAGAKAACETATSTSGHMCSSEELLRSVQSGVFIPDGWYSSGTRNTYTNTGQTWDCSGWNDANAIDYGAWWDTTNLAPGFIQCSTENPILCCD